MNRQRATPLLANIKKPLSSIVLVFIIGTVIMLAVGYDPVYAYQKLFFGMFGTRLNFGTTLEKITPVLLCGLAFVIGMKGDFFNMGVEGQMSLAAITAAWLGVQLQGILAPICVMLVCIAAGILVAMLYALIPALLKCYLNANEICTTILLNYVATLFATYLCFYPLNAGQGTSQTIKIAENSLLPYILPPSRANIGLFVALAVVVGFSFFFRKTVSGLSIQATGENRVYAEGMGIKTKNRIIVAVLMSGAVAGLAGTVEVLGVHGRFVNGFIGSIPLYGMLAALIANGSFLGVTLYSMLIAALQAGSLGMERFTGLSEEIISILISLFILFATVDLQSKGSLRKTVKALCRRAKGVKK